VGSQLGEEIGVVGEGLNFETRSIDIDSEQLGTVGTEGDLFNLVAIDQLEEVRVPHVSGLSVRVLLDDGKGIILGDSRSVRHVQCHVQLGRRSCTSRLKGRQRCEGRCLAVRHEETDYCDG
jgi:hypothetical protein